MYQVIQKDPALVLQGPQGLLRLYPVNENAVRVTQTGRDHFLPQPETENHTPVVLDKSPCPCYQVVEEEGAVTLKLKACSIRVDLATGALTYLAPTGEVLVREPRTGGRHLVETQVTRNIFSQDGELVERHTADGVKITGGDYETGRTAWPTTPRWSSSLGTRASTASAPTRRATATSGARAASSTSRT